MTRSAAPSQRTPVGGPLLSLSLLSRHDAGIELALRPAAPGGKPLGDRTQVLSARQGFVDARVDGRIVETGVALLGGVHAEHDGDLAQPLSRVAGDIGEGAAHKLLVELRQLSPNTNEIGRASCR